MTVVIIGPWRVAEEKRHELGLRRDGFIWISPSDRYAIGRLRGHPHGLEVYRPTGCSAHPDVEDFMIYMGAVEKK